MPAVPPEPLHAVVGVAVGLGLAAAAGFRVFVPLLAAGLAARFGLLPLAPGFDWLASTPALVALGTATLLEVGAYFIPWVDHALDVVAAPAAVVAGTVAAASVATDLPPALRWGVAIIAGGGAAGMVQGATTLLRLKSTLLTGGVGNVLVALVEVVGATGIAALAIALPLVALALVVVLCAVVFRLSRRVLFGRRRGAVVPAGTMAGR